ncbi:DUF6634 family protein [Phyllobacterium sp. CCNWLW109]|uniref:DUF6634 family protein n=1 Tax=Phyllobacterium sp. CCNWLW109 TaxID=3127479 RepID=UPI003076CC78
MTIEFDVNNLTCKNVKDELLRLEALKSDLTSVLIGVEPASLLSAPKLNHWLYSERFVHTIIGFVDEHPEFPDEKMHMTSQIICINQDAGWARSTSRLYRLGERMDD